MSTITVHFLTADGRSHRVSGRTGRSLMQAGVTAGISAIAADCGGCMSCATCHVYVDPPWADRVPAAKADELMMLEMTAAPREAGSRLSCQIELNAKLDGLTVRVPATQY